MKLILVVHFSGLEEGLFYSARDLEFLFFVHSLSLVGRLFIYKDGRALFPVELPDRQGKELQSIVSMQLSWQLSLPLVTLKQNKKL